MPFFQFFVLPLLLLMAKANVVYIRIIVLVFWAGHSTKSLLKLSIIK
jgi:hypothetical protein